MSSERASDSELMSPVGGVRVCEVKPKGGARWSMVE